MFQKFKRKGVSEMRPVTEAEVLAREIPGVEISEADKEAGSPKLGDMIARHPDYHVHECLVSEKRFKENYEPVQENPEDPAPLKFKNDAEKGAPITDDFLYMVHGGGWLGPEKFLEPEDAKKVRDAINLIVRYEEEGIENGYFEEI